MEILSLMIHTGCEGSDHCRTNLYNVVSFEMDDIITIFFSTDHIAFNFQKRVSDLCNSSMQVYQRFKDKH